MVDAPCQLRSDDHTEPYLLTQWMYQYHTLIMMPTEIHVPKRCRAESADVVDVPRQLPNNTLINPTWWVHHVRAESADVVDVPLQLPSDHLVEPTWWMHHVRQPTTCEFKLDLNRYAKIVRVLDICSALISRWLAIRCVTRSWYP